MSQQNPNPDDPLANFAGIYLTLIFVIVFVLIGKTSQQAVSLPATDASENEQAVALVVSTAEIPVPLVASTPLLSSTPVPPTPAPSGTPVAEPTGMVADTAMHGHTAADYDPVLAERGKALFGQCAACHGADALGLPNLGKNLVESEFLHSLTDEDLVEFIKTGRPMWDPLNTTGIDMPAKGGNPALTDDDILAIIAYIHSLVPPAGEPEAAQPVDDITVAYDPAVVARGEQSFMQCAACHGQDAHGIPNLGKNLVDSEFVHALSDTDLLTFIKTGRPLWDPLNTTGIDMPPKGGNPALTDDDILAIIAYVRSLSASS